MQLYGDIAKMDGLGDISYAIRPLIRNALCAPEYSTVKTC